MRTFGDRAASLLRSAGWFAGRSIDTSEFRRGLQISGYEVFPVVEDFLKEFGGLVIPFLFDFKRSLPGVVRLDPSSAAKSLPRAHPMTEFYIERIGAPVCVIGYQDHEILMMDPSGKVYNAFEEYLDLIGESGREAIENIFRGSKMTFKRLSEPNIPDYDVV